MHPRRVECAVEPQPEKGGCQNRNGHDDAQQDWRTDMGTLHSEYIVLPSADVSLDLSRE